MARGLGMVTPVESTARWRTPASTPTTVIWGVACRNGPLDLHGEGDEPAVGSPGDRDGQDTGNALFEAAG